MLYVEFLSLRARHFSTSLPRDQQQPEAERHSTRDLAFFEVEPERPDLIVVEHALSRSGLRRERSALDARGGIALQVASLHTERG